MIATCECPWSAISGQQSKHLAGVRNMGTSMRRMPCCIDTSQEGVWTVEMSSMTGPTCLLMQLLQQPVLVGPHAAGGKHYAASQTAIAPPVLQ